MGVIATLIPSKARLQRVRAAVRDRHEIVACARWDDVSDACESLPVRLVIADLFAEGTASFERVRALKRRFPHLTVMMYSEVTAEDAHDIFDAGRQGIDGLIVADHDDAPRALLAVIERAEAKSLVSVLRYSLRGVDEMVTDAVLLAVSRAHERLAPQAMARLLALPRPVLAQRLAAAGFPSPQRLLTWGSLIMAAHLLEDPNRPADRVAASLGFPSGSAFRNVCQRYLHSTPGEIRRRGGATFVANAMMRHTHAIDAADGTVQPSSRRRHAIAL
jgi:AraC-like DNA-binding protein